MKVLVLLLSRRKMKNDVTKSYVCRQVHRQGLHGREDGVGDRDDVRAQLQQEVRQVPHYGLQLCAGNIDNSL